jgi:hypothetical protein
VLAVKRLASVADKLGKFIRLLTCDVQTEKQANWLRSNYVLVRR